MIKISYNLCLTNKAFPVKLKSVPNNAILKPRLVNNLYKLSNVLAPL